MAHVIALVRGRSSKTEPVATTVDDTGGSVACSRCGTARPRELADWAPRTPCPECGETTITINREFTATQTMTASLEATLRPADQARDWTRRWKEIQRELAELLAPQTGGMSAEAIHAARNRLHSFYVQA